MMTSSHKLRIRRAEYTDIDAMSDLLHELFDIEADFTTDPERQKRGLRLLVDGCGKHRAVLVAGWGRRVVGMATAQLVISTAAGGLSAWVEDLVVASEHRGQGIGRRLLSTLSAWAVEVGAVRLQLVADRDNLPALRFYRDQGWQETRLLCLRKGPER
jgi:GNAT superfamily N-acetyltransferase